MVLEYVTDRLVETVADEIGCGRPVLLVDQSLIKAHAKEYVRRTQERLIGTPILQLLNVNHDEHATEQRLLDMLERWRGRPLEEQATVRETRSTFCGCCAARHQFAVARQRYAKDRAGVAPHCGQVLSGRRLTQSHRAILTDAGHNPTISRQRYVPDRARVASQSGHPLAGVDFP
jgi:hypothetical protein